MYDRWVNAAPGAWADLAGLLIRALAVPFMLGFLQATFAQEGKPVSTLRTAPGTAAPRQRVGIDGDRTMKLSLQDAVQMALEQNRDIEIERGKVRLSDYKVRTAEGAYDAQGYRLRGRLRTDERGFFVVHTLVPGRYLNGPTYRPRHIHVKVSAAGHAPLTTQLYFAGDPFNATDAFFDEPIAAAPGASFRGGDGIVTVVTHQALAARAMDGHGHRALGAADEVAAALTHEAGRETATVQE